MVVLPRLLVLNAPVGREVLKLLFFQLFLLVVESAFKVADVFELKLIGRPSGLVRLKFFE